MGDVEQGGESRAAVGLQMFATTDTQLCPYLVDQQEQRLFTTLSGTDADGRHDVLMRAGFRRSQSVLYRPVCPDCTACRSIRIPVERLELSRSLKKVLKRNADLVGTLKPARFSEEHYLLFDRYIRTRHGDGGMATMTRAAFRRMLEDAPVTSFLAEFRNAEGRLVAASLTDAVATGFSGVYKYFDPDAADRSLGTFVILWLCQEAMRHERSYLYLGYWIEGSRKMAYKARFRPLEILQGSTWVPFSPPASTAAVVEVARP